MSQAKFIYKYNPDLPILKDGWKGNKIIGGIYVNGDKPEKPKSFLEVLKWKMSQNPQAEEKKNDPFSLRVMNNQAFAQKSKDMIVWLGHSSFFIRIGGTNILTDPCFTNLPFIPRLAGLPCQVYDMTGIDYILLSHNHRDHFDKPSLKLILKYNPDVEFLVPLGMGKLLKTIGVQNCQEAGWWQRFKTKDQHIKVDFLPARHWNRRGLTDFNTMLWGSFHLSDGNNSIYFAGDTAYGNHFGEIQQYYQEIDYCLMPIGAYKPEYFMEEAHISPQYAVTAFNELNAKHFIPMHYGTYDLSDEPLGEPIRIVKKEFSQGLSDGNLLIPDIGHECLLE